MKRILLTLLLVPLVLATPAAASVVSFDFTFSPVAITGYTNNVSATGTIGLDTGILATAGRYIYDPGNQYAVDYAASANLLVQSLTITVKDSQDQNVNTTFTISDFDGVLFDTGVLNVDLARQLFGQINYSNNGDWSWGTYNVNTDVTGATKPQSYTGDFQLFSLGANANPSAPTGVAPYTLATIYQLNAGESGNPDPIYETMKLTSFGPSAVPEPSTYALLCLSLGVVGYARKKIMKTIDN